MPEGLSELEFFEGYSVPRNKELMRVFKDLDLVEQLGSGVPRILESYNKSCFTFTDNFLRMVLPINGDQVGDQIGNQVGGQVGGQVGNQVGGQVGGQVGHLTDRQKEVLDLIIKDPSISRKALSEKLDINPSAIQKHIDALKQKGIISRESETTGFWEIHIDKQVED